MGSKTYLKRRGKTYFYRRRVPSEVAHLDKRQDVVISLKTDSESVALRKAVLVNDRMEQYWDDLLQYGSDEALKRYQGAVRIARRHGFSYRPVEELAEGDLSDLVSRLNSIGNQGVEDKPTADAVLGGVPKPMLNLEQALEDFWTYAADLTDGKNPDQVRRWKNPRIKAVRNFISVAGLKPLDKYTRDDALLFRDWWLGRLESENLSKGSANKDIGHLSQIFREVSEKQRLNITNPFERLRFREGKKNKRPSFPTRYIRETLLNLNNLSGLNDEGKFLIAAAASTGAGINELCGLDEDDILLEKPDYWEDDDGNNPFCPHIIIRPNKIRNLKTDYRPRSIPLVGSALWAFKQLPHGFQEYRGKNVLLGSVVNKYLRENDLFPSNDHTLYSLRHTFQTELNRLKIIDRIQAELMGHKFGRPEYGEEIPLKDKLEVLQQMAYPEPTPAAKKVRLIPGKER